MTTDPKRSKGRDGALSVLGIAIEGLNLAKEISSITPAKAVFGSASVILAMIKVRCFLLFYGNKLQLHVCPGLYGQRAGLHRSRVVLRRSVRCPRPGIEREAAGRTRSAGARGDWATDYVRWSINAGVGRRAYQRCDRRTLAEMERKIIKMSKRSAVSRLLRAKNDKETITAWRQDLDRILHIFNVSAAAQFCFLFANGLISD